jgi:cytoskeletal protein CcmA (bactofilin family)
MAQARSASRNGGETPGVIGAGTRVRGRITGDGHLTVEGEVEGDITLRGDLVVEGGASVTSNVDAYGVTVSGALEGDVTAHGAVHIAASARVRGDVRSEHIQIDDGAQFAGRLECDFELPTELQGTGGSRKRS